MSAYPIPAAPVQVETEVKKSRFIARALHVTCREQAMAALDQAVADYPDARHHCWAYLLGNPQSAASAAMSDDGEPSGTAGKPILNVLQHKGVGDVMLIVIRYFGGIKLGAGGLVRAYSGAAQSAMEVLAVEQREARLQMTLQLEFAAEQGLRHWLGLHGGEVVSTDYGESVQVVVELPEKHQDELIQFVQARAIQVIENEA